MLRHVGMFMNLISSRMMQDLEHYQVTNYFYHSVYDVAYHFNGEKLYLAVFSDGLVGYTNVSSDGQERDITNNQGEEFITT